jgi:hypothetical protein
MNYKDIKIQYETRWFISCSVPKGIRNGSIDNLGGR